MKTVSDPGVPLEECLQVLTWQGVVVEASGNVFLTRSDKMDNLVAKGIAIAFNNMNNVFASTMKDVDQLLAAVSCGCYIHLYPIAMATGWLSVGYIRDIHVIGGLRNFEQRT